MGELKVMTDGQYRALVSYLSFWPKLTKDRDWGLTRAMQDIGINAPRDSVTSALWKAGWVYDEDSEPMLRYDGEG